MAEPMQTIAPLSPDEMRDAVRRLGLERLSDEHLALSLDYNLWTPAMADRVRSQISRIQ